MSRHGFCLENASKEAPSDGGFDLSQLNIDLTSAAPLPLTVAGEGACGPQGVVLVRAMHFHCLVSAGLSV